MRKNNDLPYITLKVLTSVFVDQDVVFFFPFAWISCGIMMSPTGADL